MRGLAAGSLRSVAATGGVVWRFGDVVMCRVLCRGRCATARPRAARGYQFRDVDERLTRDRGEAPEERAAWTLAIVAMMPSCRCFARRVKLHFVVSEGACPAQVLVLTGAGYCAWGCFRIFCLDAALACRATE